MFRISYRALRYLASYSVGGLALVGVFAFLWGFTNCSLPATCFWCIVAYVIAGAVVWTISAPKPRQPGNVPIVNLKEKEDEHTNRRK